MSSHDMTDDPIDMVVLLSTCIDACRRGCEVIRNVRHRMMQSNSNNSNNNNADFHDTIMYKIAGDPRSALTEADGASQRVIIECLTSCWAKEIKCGKIKIVGEEEDEHYSTDLDDDDDEGGGDHDSFDTAFSEDIHIHFDDYNCPRPDCEPIIKDMFVGSKAATDDEDQLSSPPPPPQPYYQHGNDNNSSIEGTCYKNNTNEIIIFIDPMDGTREFVEGRIQNVQCLIGNTYNGIPVAGAVGLPMVHTTQIEIAYGLISTKMMKKKKKDDWTSGGLVEEEIVPVPVLSGIKLFHALNPLLVKNTSSSSSSTYTTTHDSTIDNVDDETDNSRRSSSSDDTLLLFSGDSMKPSLNLAMECLEHKILCDRSGEDCDNGDYDRKSIDECHLHPTIRKVIVGGCGHKILSVQ